MKPALRNATLIVTIRVVAVAGIGAAANCALDTQHSQEPGEGFVHGNGQIEATEMDVTTRRPGRVQHVFVREGDFVVAGQRLALIQHDTIQAERDEVVARRRQALDTAASAEAEVAVWELECQAADAAMQHRQSELEAAQRRLDRTEMLTSQGALSQRDLDNERAMTRHAEAAVSASELHRDAACDAVAAARLHLTGARSAVAAVEAAGRRSETAFVAFELKAPRDGRVLDRLAEPGEVLEAGSRVLKILDFADVHLTFGLPDAIGGRVTLGSEVRIVLDGVQRLVVPATVSSLHTATNPPDTPAIATAQTRGFRVKAEIDRELLRHNLELLTTGRSGVAWVRVDPRAKWPAALSVSPELTLRPRSGSHAHPLSGNVSDNSVR